ncbi:hypothetical protein WR25_07180 [Diploscapter pachys]|uniref:RNA polymerase sigma factor 70 region 4 type 2 domain-containing protein n=1 Tax=Diploscapter pachys TaxID=2018661 RepID=A0A2A2KBZ2_9BILA|nr:hypothetical protein WR25_07180 [Diploscapter pachys]
MQRLFPAGHHTLHTRLGDPVNRGDLASGEPTGAHRLRRHRQQLSGRGKRSIREQRQQPPEDRLGRPRMQLLVGNGPHQRLVGLTTGGRPMQAGPHGGNMPRPVRILLGQPGSGSLKGLRGKALQTMQIEDTLKPAEVDLLYQAHHRWLRGWLGARQRLLILDTLERLDLALQRLKPRARQAFLLAQLDGLSLTQIAQRLDVSRATVERDLAKALGVCYRMRYADA